MSMRVESEVLDGRRVTVYDSGVDGAPAVYASMFTEMGDRLIGRCREMGCPAFDLVSLTDLNWDEDLSPWEADPVVTEEDHFTGGSDAYAGYLEGDVIPYAEGVLGRSGARVIAGYSMGGLFALYAPYVSDAFSACVSASGSVWFPGFVDYARDHPFKRVPTATYMSIGDRESRTSNPYLARTEGNFGELRDIFSARGVETVFELNPGNHFVDADIRMAKGIAWVLSRQRRRCPSRDGRHRRSVRHGPSLRRRPPRTSPSPGYAASSTLKTTGGPHRESGDGADIIDGRRSQRIINIHTARCGAR